MTEFQKFVVHIRNLKSQGVKNIMLEVDYLNLILKEVSPLPTDILKAKESKNIQVVGDGGNFFEE